MRLAGDSVDASAFRFLQTDGVGLPCGVSRMLTGVRSFVSVRTAGAGDALGVEAALRGVVCSVFAFVVRNFERALTGGGEVAVTEGAVEAEEDDITERSERSVVEEVMLAVRLCNSSATDSSEPVEGAT